MVALARKLLIALSRYVTHGEIPAGPRRAAGLRHNSAAKPERRGPPSDLARAGDAAAGAPSAHEPHSRTAIRPGDHQLQSAALAVVALCPVTTRLPVSQVLGKGDVEGVLCSIIRPSSKPLKFG